MKIFSFIILIILSSKSFAQTSVIALRSHSGDLNEINMEQDNYGWIEPRPILDSIVRINDTCVVKHSTNWSGYQSIDTICNHPALKPYGYSLKSCEELFGKEGKYIGFKKKGQNDGSQMFWSNGGVQQNNIVGLFALILMSFVAYLIAPFLRRERK